MVEPHPFQFHPEPVALEEQGHLLVALEGQGVQANLLQAAEGQEVETELEGGVGEEVAVAVAAMVAAVVERLGFWHE